MNKITFFMFIGSAVFNVNAVSIFVKDTLTANRRWQADTVFITGNVFIKKDVTLKIDPGTRIIFNGYFRIIVKGAMQAPGKVNDSIYFQPSDTSTGFHGIRFEYPSTQSNLEYCSFKKGKAKLDGRRDDQKGGALYIDLDRLVELRNCTFEGNTADEYGGAIFCKSKLAIIEECVFESNAAKDGGAIYVVSGSPQIRKCIFKRNTANARGGAIGAYNSMPQITLNRFQRNTAIHGGAIGCKNAVALIAGNLLVFNKSSNGGGVELNEKASAKLINNTFFRNRAIYGGALYCDENSDPIVTNTIMWKDSARHNGHELYSRDNFSKPVISHCVIRNYPGYHFEALFADELSLDLKLRPESPCVDSGVSDTSGLSLPEKDIAGNLRVNGGRIDIGAYEYSIPAMIRQKSRRNGKNIFIGRAAQLMPSALSSFQRHITTAGANIQIYSLDGKFVYDFHKLSGQKLPTIITIIKQNSVELPDAH